MSASIDWASKEASPLLGAKWNVRYLVARPTSVSGALAKGAIYREAQGTQSLFIGSSAHRVLVARRTMTHKEAAALSIAADGKFQQDGL